MQSCRNSAELFAAYRGCFISRIVFKQIRNRQLQNPEATCRFSDERIAVDQASVLAVSHLAAYSRSALPAATRNSASPLFPTKEASSQTSEKYSAED